MGVEAKQVVVAVVVGVYPPLFFFLFFFFLMALPPEDVACLDAYIEAWEKGSAEGLHGQMSDEYKFTMIGSEPVPKAEFVEFIDGFRKSVAEAGGPSLESDDFMKIHGQVRKQIGDTTVEAGIFVIDQPGNGAGTYVCAACNGKMLWEEASMLPFPVKTDK